MSDSVSPNLVLEGGRLSCRACGSDLAAAGGSYKAAAIRREIPLAQVGAAYDTGFAGDIVLRQFYCPNCATLLDTETAAAGEPVLDDRIEA